MSSIRFVIFINDISRQRGVEMVSQELGKVLNCMVVSLFSSSHKSVIRRWLNVYRVVLHNKKDFNIIITNPIVAAFSSFLLKNRIIFWHQQDFHDYPKLVKLLLRLSKFTKIVTPNIQQASVFSDEVVIIPNIPRQIKRLNIYKDYLVVSHITPSKGIYNLFDYSEEISNIIGNKIILFGRGDLSEELDKYIKFIDYRGYESDVNAIYKTAKVLLNFSTSENYPTTFIESLSVGVLILSRRFTGCEQVFAESRNIYFFNTKSELLSLIREIENGTISYDWNCNFSSSVKKENIKETWLKLMS